MESRVALDVARPPCLSLAASNPSTSRGSSVVSRCCSWRPRHGAQVRLNCVRHNGGELRRTRAVAISMSLSSSSPLRKWKGQYRMVVLRAGKDRESAAAEPLEVGEVTSSSEDDAATAIGEGVTTTLPAGVSDEDLGIDEDGNLTGGLPPEFHELMKDEGTPINFWVLGIGLVVIFLARKIIWAELQRWGKLAAYLCLGAIDLVLYAFAKLIGLGGEPLASVIAAVVVVLLAIRNFFQFIAGVVSPGPVLLSVFLASSVLLVGESVSDTFGSSRRGFPSRKTLDTAGVLGLGGLIGLVPGEVVLLGLAAITAFLLIARKFNPVAAFTPAVGVMAAVSIPPVRYPVLLAFAGPCLYRYWKLGYLSQGAVPNERKVEYPFVLKGLLYLAATSFASRTTFSIVRYIQAAIAVARA